MRSFSASNFSLSLINVCKSFGERIVLQNCSFTVPEGKSFVLMGLSGSGKSVSLKCILNLMEIDSGEIQWQKKSDLSNIGVVLQSCGLFDSLTVLENIAFRALRLYSRPVALQKARDALEQVGLPSNIEPLYPHQISGGMKKRVSLARAILLNPQYLFFDEPTAGLDPISAHKIAALMRSVVQRLNATALIITHDIATIPLIADYIGLLFEGKIIWQGAAEEMKHCADPRMQQFLRGDLEGPLTN
jgi:phospholipid/cholesterol/gamma-HCH transport system ATP-binding protein